MKCAREHGLLLLRCRQWSLSRTAHQLDQPLAPRVKVYLTYRIER